MDSTWYIHFVNVASILIFLILSVVSQDCKKTSMSSCSCMFPNGSVINLRPIARDNTPRWRDLPSKSDTYNYSFNPCIDFMEGSGDCSGGVAVCQSKITNDSYNFYNLGTNADAQFKWNTENNALTLKYEKPPRKTLITLVCSYNKEDNLTVWGEKETNNYFMTLTSVCACPDGCSSESSLSTGSVLVILFFVFLGVYLLGGMCYMKIVRGASGKELIPNYDFWLDFPLLVRDGVVFICTGCRAGTTYERI